MSEMTEDQRDALRRVEKLMKLAGRTTSEQEAASATAKAMELLAAYNLEISAIGSGSDDTGARAEEKIAGGHYEWERSLMDCICEINLCICWSRQVWVPRPKNEQAHAKVQQMRDRWTREHIRRWEYQIVGRAHNVAASRTMYDYLLSTIDRATREYLVPGYYGTEERVVGMGAMLRSRRACSFREGVADEVTSRLWERRREQLSEERRAAQELQEAAQRARAERGAAGPGTALTLAELTQTERDANLEHALGQTPGTQARQRAAAREAEQRRAEARRVADEAAAAWALAHPEEARAAEAERRREERRRAGRRERATGPGSRGGTSHLRTVDEAAYSAGHRRGATIGIDPQSSGGRRGAGITQTRLLT